MLSSHGAHAKPSIVQSRHVQWGALLLLILLPGCVLPAILSLAKLLPGDAPFFSTLTTVALALCLVLALRGPWFLCLTGGILTMVGALLVRLPQLYLLPGGIFLYELICYALAPFLLLGTGRFWLWITGRQGISYLLSIITFLALRLGAAFGWYLIINNMYLYNYNIHFVFPLPSQLLRFFLLFCGVYLIFSLATFRQESDRENPQLVSEP